MLTQRSHIAEGQRENLKKFITGDPRYHLLDLLDVDAWLVNNLQENPFGNKGDVTMRDQVVHAKD